MEEAEKKAILNFYLLMIYLFSWQGNHQNVFNISLNFYLFLEENVPIYLWNVASIILFFYSKEKLT